MSGWNRSKNWIGMLLLLVLVGLTLAAHAESYEKVYGITKDRIRVRAGASLSADIIDNLRADSCVYLLSGEKSGSTVFVKLRYRNAEGKLETGYAALKSGGSVYIEVLTDKEAQNKFDVSGGKLPSAPAGVMTRAERQELKGGSSSEKSDDSSDDKKESNDGDDVSEETRKAQEGLAELGLYHGEITGHAGNKTVAAIKAFQKSKGIKQSGEADDATLKALQNALAKEKEKKSTEKKDTASQSGSSSGSLRIDSTGSTVRTLQKNLTTLGYYYGDITGHYGEKTAVAVRKFQADNGLKETGTANRETLRKIASAAARAAKAATTAAPKRSSGTSGRIYNLNWFTAKENGVFPKIGFGAGKTANLKDIATGKSLQVRIQSSGYHLDVEPLTERDTKTLCSIYGVKDAEDIGFERRSMLLTTVHGYRIVCSCYGTPHGTKMVRGNNFPGQFCLHFLNSKTSGSGVVDNGHQAAVRRAAASFGSGRVKKLDEPDDLE